MRVQWCTLPVAVLFGALSAVLAVEAATTQDATPVAKPPVTYPQIVRLSYVEGDVRVARGKEAKKLLEQESGESTGWEQAVANLPLETGYSLATGTGRAEIELEDASVVYLGENSVLEFIELSTTGGVPHTEMDLLTGMATVNIRTMLPGESFKMGTPSDGYTMHYPQKPYLRFNSYLDAIAVTPLKDVSWSEPSEDIAGQTVTVHNGRRVATPQMDATAMAEWNKWVAGRVTTRTATMESTMTEAGLTAPLPGMAEMNGQGKFFACEPYGTCWEPTEGWAGDKVELAQTGSASGSARTQDATQPAAPVVRVAVSDDQTVPASAPQATGASQGSAQSKADAYLASHPGTTLRTEDYTFPCSEFAVRDLIAVDPATGRETIIASEFASDGYPYFAGWPYTVGVPHRMTRVHRLSGSLWNFAEFNGYEPWDWTVCHTGSWIRWQHRYVWVVGTKRHHHPPVRWVKRGREVGYVPIHPRDVAGKPPINMKEGIFKATKKDGAISVERIRFDGDKPVEPLNEAPKEFRKLALEPLKSAELPHAEAYSAFRTTNVPKGMPIVKDSKGGANAIAFGAAKSGAATGIAVAVKQPGLSITFDRKSQSFMVARPGMENGRPATTVEPLGGRVGSVQANGSGAATMRPTSSASAQSYGGGQNRPTTSTGSYSNAGTPARAYTPAPSSNGGGGYSRPSAPAPSYSPPPAPSYSPPSSPSGGSSGGGSAAHR
jgi:hypothetical protein